MPSAHSLRQAGIADDEAVAVELYVGRERARTEAHDTTAERHVALRRPADAQIRHGYPRHCVIACVSAFVKPIAQHRERVEERREAEVEIERLARERLDAATQVARSIALHGAAVDLQALADESGARLEDVVHPVVDAELRALRVQPIGPQVDKCDLKQRPLEPLPGVDGQNSSSRRAASTTRSADGM